MLSGEEEVMSMLFGNKFYINLNYSLTSDKKITKIRLMIEYPNHFFNFLLIRSVIVLAYFFINQCPASIRCTSPPLS